VSTSCFTINQITLREIHLDLVEPFRSSSGIETTRRILLIELRDTDGQTAWGECVALSTPHYLPETIDTAWLTISNYIAPRILGHAFQSPSAVAPFIGENIRGHNMAKAAVEMACWALIAQKENISLSRLLGGTRTQVSTGISLGIQSSPRALTEKVQQSLEEGYARVKIKIHPDKDIEYLHTLRNALGDAPSLMVDANSAYTLDHLDHLKKFDPFNLTMIEQPLAWNDIIHHAQLQKSINTPICLDESILSLKNAHDMHTLDAGRIINLKPGRVGGFTESLSIDQFASEKKIPLWCGGMLESGIGRAYNVALASLPGFTLPGDLSPSRRYWKQDIITPEWDMDKNGNVNVPHNQPGLGIEIDTERIEALTTRKKIIE
jgi:O-succinylbenzoate synthase